MRRKSQVRKISDTENIREKVKGVISSGKSKSGHGSLIWKIALLQ